MSLKKKLGAGVAAVVIATATPFIAKWEGLETTAYRDIVGVPTVCYGKLVVSRWEIPTPKLSVWTC